MASEVRFDIDMIVKDCNSISIDINAGIGISNMALEFI